MVLAHNALAIAATQSIFLGLAWIFVVSRLYIRKCMVHGVALDDYFLVFTLLCYTVLAAMISVLASIDVFNHSVTLEVEFMHLDQLTRGVLYFFLAEVFYTITAASLRITVGLLLLRIAHTRAQKVTVYVTMLIMVAISIAFLGLVIGQCTPIAYYWDFSPSAKGDCYIEHHILPNAAYAYAAVSFLSDWILGLTPVWLLWRVRISRNKKIGIGFMLSLGLLCGLAAITRIAYIGKLNPVSFESYWIGLGICSVIEPGLGIIAASIAAFRPVFATEWFISLSSRSWSVGDSLNPWSRAGGRSGREKTSDSALTGTSLGKVAKYGSGGGGVDAEHGIKVTYEIDRSSVGAE